MLVFLGRIQALPEMLAESAATPSSDITVTEDISTTEGSSTVGNTTLPQDAVPSPEDDEGRVRNRSRFPEHPEFFRPMPIPDPSKKPPGPGKEDPEIPQSQTIEDEL